MLDANIVLSGAASSSGTLHELIIRWTRNEFSVSLSQHIVDTVSRVMGKPYWVSHASREDILATTIRFSTMSSIVEPTPGIHGVAEDDEDDLVLATAVAAEADFLVTGDRYLLDIGEFQGVRIVTARDFLDELVNRDDNNADED